MEPDLLAVRVLLVLLNARTISPVDKGPRSATRGPVTGAEPRAVGDDSARSACLVRSCGAQRLSRTPARAHAAARLGAGGQLLEPGPRGAPQAPWSEGGGRAAQARRLQTGLPEENSPAAPERRPGT